MATIIESLKRSVATATLDIEDAEAEKDLLLEAWIRTRKQERHRMEAELAAGKKCCRPTHCFGVCSVIESGQSPATQIAF